VRRLYEEVCHRMADGFTKALVRAKWSVPGVAQHTGVFADHVANRSYPIAYFLVDAMRYEMGVELTERLPPTAEVSIRPAIGVLPSITPIGMSALMPGAATSFSVVETGGKLGGRIDDAFLPDLAARKKHAAARACPKLVDLSLDEVLLLPPSKLQKKIAGAQVVLVRSQEIDHAGEGVHAPGPAGDGHRHRQPRAGGRKLARGRRARCHQRRPRPPVLRRRPRRVDAHRRARRRTVELHRRCWIGRGGATPPGCVRVQASELGYASDLELVFPAGAGVFKAGGTSRSTTAGPRSRR
jgi:hypothetical protein